MGGGCSQARPAKAMGEASADSNSFFSERHSPLKLTEDIFQKYDRNGNGQLDVKELSQLMADAFPKEKISQEDMQEMLTFLDCNHDGHVGVNELRAFLRCYDPATKRVTRKRALVIIDVQNDFISGSLANPYNAVEIVPVINGMRDAFDVVVISYDWHPHDHCSFVESVNAGKVAIKDELKEFAPFTQVTLTGDSDRAAHTQTLYPRHAVQDSEGGRCHKDLVLRDTDLKVFKGTRPNIDSYSAFFDNCKANDTGLTALLDKAGVTDVYCCGLVFDICVKSTALHGAEMGFRSFVIEDASKPLSEDNRAETRTQLREAGVEVLKVQDAVAVAGKDKELAFKDFMASVKEQKTAMSVHAQSQNTLSSHALKL